MTATVRKFDKRHWKVERTFEVKNLGWLLRHMHDVTNLTLTGRYEKPDSGNISLIATLMIDGIMHTYYTQFAEYGVMLKFVNGRKAWSALVRYYL